eukprot:gb/GEZJ01003613.1/.p1 GENE.gb/GEZJ01003613.1/~~gb/GEZJ01003613.1/.p1  ORF type:complete len:223 (-),score=13.29 gb/GEZJ01003613.1/:270-938(-)
MLHLSNRHTRSCNLHSSDCQSILHLIILFCVHDHILSLMTGVTSIHCGPTLLLLAFLLYFTRSTGTTFTCTRFKGCVSETGLRAYCHQPRVPSIALTAVLQSPTIFFDVYGFFPISQRFYLYRNGTIITDPQPVRNLWCYVGISVSGNELDFKPQNISTVQNTDADFGPLNPFVKNANSSSIFVPVDESVNTNAALEEIENNEDSSEKGKPFGLCCAACRRR